MEPFKNELSYKKALLIANAIKRAYPNFPLSRFRKGLETEILALELKQRMHLIADSLEACLPTHPPQLFSILIASLGGVEKDGLKSFPIWPLTEIVARRGLSHFPEAMEALAELTKRFTAEFSIRPFIAKEPEKTFEQLHRWCDHPNEHVRRLVSEGSRPFLPWGGNLPQLLEKPFPTLALLEKLHRDESDYVRLSVSNHLNDFSKKHPELVVGILKRWLAESPEDKRIAKLARHACRTLLKTGHPGALDLHGYASAERLKVSSKISPATVKLGGALNYSISISNPGRKGMHVMFDYAIHHIKANGSLSPKVFKGRTGEIAAGETWEITGRHVMKKVTTRVYHSGLHLFEPRINGKAFDASEFSLEIIP